MPTRIGNPKKHAQRDREVSPTAECGLQWERFVEQVSFEPGVEQRKNEEL